LFSDPNYLLSAFNWVIPETIYQTRALILFSLIAITSLLFFEDIKIKKRVLTILGFLFFVFTTHVVYILFYLLLVILMYLISHTNIQHKIYYFIFLVLLLFLSPFLIYSTLNKESIFYSFISYYTIYKVIHYYIEVNKDSKFKRKVEDFLFYILFFPCLCHGPIERINALFIDSIKKEDILYGFKKFGLGLIKLNFYFYFLKDLPNKDIAFLFIIYIKTINFYIQLSADWDIVIGVARLMGVKLRENFPRNPFLQPNLTKFWRNCHVTLIDWYFSYFYIPIAKNNRLVNLKLISVFMLILGMHAFFNITKFPSLNAMLYYVLMGMWFGITLVISKTVSGYFKRKDVKCIISRAPRFIGNLVYGNSMILYIFNVIVNFNICAFGLWYSPLYKLII